MRESREAVTQRQREERPARDERRKLAADVMELRRQVVKALARYKQSIVDLREARAVLARAEEREKSRGKLRKL